VLESTGILLGRKTISAFAGIPNSSVSFGQVKTSFHCHSIPTCPKSTLAELKPKLYCDTNTSFGNKKNAYAALSPPYSLLVTI